MWAPLLILTPLWLAGIFLQGWLVFETRWLWLGVGASLLIALFYWLVNRSSESLKRLPIMLPLCLLFACAGALRYQMSLLPEGSESLTYWAGDKDGVPELRVIGLITNDPVYSEKGGSFRLTTTQLFPPGGRSFGSVSGDIFVTFAEGISIQPGDQVELSGQLRLPLEFTEDQFPYRDYLKRQGIYAVMYKPSVDVVATGQNFFLFRWLSTLRNNSLEIIRNFMPAREAGLLGGILLGEQRSLDPQLKQNFQITGSSHIIAISGANITIAIGAMMLLFQRLFRKRTALILSLAGVSGYVLLVGASPGVVRAGVMGGFAIVGLLLGREYFSLLGLAGTTFLMTLASPQVFYDIGFQLSCLATLGLILIASPLQKYRWVQKLPPLYGEGVIMGVAAELMTLPLVVFYFKQIALFSLPVGVVGLPALPMIMASGALLVVGGWLFAVWLPLLVNILGWLSWSFVVYLAEVVNFFAAIPFAAISVPQLHPVWLVIYYGLLAFGISYWRAMPDSPYRVNLNRLIRSPAVLPLLLGITGLVWLAIFFG